MPNLTQETHALLWGGTLLDFLSHTALLILAGMAVLKVYRSANYLFHFENRKDALATWAEFALPAARRIPFKGYRKYLETHLARSGAKRQWTVDHLLAMQLVIGLGSFGLLFVGYVVLLGGSLLLSTLAAASLVILPVGAVVEKSKKRLRSVKRDLPFFVDYLGLAMNAGADFNAALTAVLEAAPPSPVKEEFQGVQLTLEMGRTREQALQNLEERLPLPEVKSFCRTVVQASDLGSDVSKTLRELSVASNERRFQTAEEAAGSISVHMMIPMMVFVLPSVMIVLLGPLLLSFMQVNG